MELAKQLILVAETSKGTLKDAAPTLVELRNLPVLVPTQSAMTVVLPAAGKAGAHHQVFPDVVTIECRSVVCVVWRRGAFAPFFGDAGGRGGGVPSRAASSTRRARRVAYDSDRMPLQCLAAGGGEFRPTNSVFKALARVFIAGTAEKDHAAGQRWAPVPLPVQAQGRPAQGLARDGASCRREQVVPSGRTLPTTQPL